MATPGSQRPDANPTRSNLSVSRSTVEPLVTARAEQASRTDRRKQIAEQVEAQINREVDPLDQAMANWIKNGPETLLADWTSVKRSRMPLDMKYEENRRKGWERGKREEVWFEKNYRRDWPGHAYLRFKFFTPNNSRVSKAHHWQSGNWLKKTTKPAALPSNVRRIANNPKLVEAVKRAAEESAEKNWFLGKSYPKLGAFWKGVKVLGRGGQGIVGLWEYVGPGEHIWGRRIVIKQTLKHPLDEEADMMLQLNDGTDTATHAVQLLYPIAVDNSKPQTLAHIILEYCEGGDLDSLLIKHSENKEPFSEENLWLFFECFAKGLSLMDHGNERPERKPDSRNPMCHFDLKPLNILRGGLDDEHNSMPVNKIADFGLAALIDPVTYEPYSRRRGTQGHLAPEQFSRRWGFQDAETCGHVNVYGTHTNIWQMGVMMYMLATLRGPPRPKGFRNPAIGKRFTYGYGLYRTNYSRALRSLIWRCLCDKPKDRPSLMKIDKEIQSALTAIRMNPSAAEPKQQLNPPEPQPPKESPQGPPSEMDIENPAAGPGTLARGLETLRSLEKLSPLDTPQPVDTPRPRDTPRLVQTARLVDTGATGKGVDIPAASPGTLARTAGTPRPEAARPVEAPGPVEAAVKGKGAKTPTASPGTLARPPATRRPVDTPRPAATGAKGKGTGTPAAGQRTFARPAEAGGPATTRTPERGTEAQPPDAATTGDRASPYIVPSGTKVLRRRAFTFCVVPKHLPEGLQEPIWFQAAPDSTVRGLKQVLRELAELDLADEQQFIYMRLPGQPVLLLENMARMLSLYGVGQDMRLELWTDREKHDEAEPRESEFDVI